jgi:hypothetical protein
MVQRMYGLWQKYFISTYRTVFETDAQYMADFFINVLDFKMFFEQMYDLNLAPNLFIEEKPTSFILQFLVIICGPLNVSVVH